MSQHYGAINSDSNRSAGRAGALVWVTEHPKTLLLGIYFRERSQGEGHSYADSSVRPCTAAATHELCSGTFRRHHVKNNPGVSFLHGEVFMLRAGQGLNFVSAE